ncbi:hypothetical protein EDB85DRAFT_1894142 [Lactarius pseudohatsudake]|nr:hypothetical protein EDB85DRAFT_1894142 [Lactarius pseudohatsudake]
MLPPLPVVPGPSPSPLTAPPKGHARTRDPRPHPSPCARKGGVQGHTAPYAHGKGAREGTPPPAPPCTRTPLPLPVALGRSPSPVTAPPCTCGKGARHPGPTLPLSHGRGGPMPPPHSVVHGPLWSRRPVRESTPPPGPILPPGRAVWHTRKGAREGKPPPAGGAPFAREGAHEGKPSPPPYVLRSGVDAVSARPCSSRPHRDFRAP